MLVKKMTDLIGRTPLLEIDPAVHGLKNITVYAKLEHLNPFGSLKDRPAWNILQDQIATAAGAGQTVIESSSGNMAKAMTVFCNMHGVKFRVVTSKIPVREVKQMLQLLGAEVTEFPGMSSCPDPSDPNNPVAWIERQMAAEPGKYLHTTQFTNEKNNGAHFDHTGPEILEDLGGTKVDYFIAGMGTTGSSRGTSDALRVHNPDLKMIGVVAKKGDAIPGIRNADEMFEVGLYKKELYDRVVEVSVDDAIDGIIKLTKIGVLAGPTSGAAFSAALQQLRVVDASLSEKRTAVFIVNDRVEWYLSYLQKYRPELFGVEAKKDTPRHVPEAQTKKAKELTAAAAEKWLNEADSRLVVDLRGALAFKASHIAGSINLPVEQLDDLSEWGVPFSRDQKVLFVCPVGDQSKRFVAYFSGKGIDCASLKGGFIAWRDAGKPLQKAVAPKK